MNTDRRRGGDRGAGGGEGFCRGRDAASRSAGPIMKIGRRLGGERGGEGFCWGRDAAWRSCGPCMKIGRRCGGDRGTGSGGAYCRAAGRPPLARCKWYIGGLPLT